MSNFEKQKNTPVKDKNISECCFWNTHYSNLFLFSFRRYLCTFYGQMKALCNIDCQQKNKPDTDWLPNVNVCVCLKIHQITSIMLLEISAASEW